MDIHQTTVAAAISSELNREVQDLHAQALPHISTPGAMGPSVAGSPPSFSAPWW